MIWDSYVQVHKPYTEIINVFHFFAAPLTLRLTLRTTRTMTVPSVTPRPTWLWLGDQSRQIPRCLQVSCLANPPPHTPSSRLRHRVPHRHYGMVPAPRRRPVTKIPTKRWSHHQRQQSPQCHRWCPATAAIATRLTQRTSVTPMLPAEMQHRLDQQATSPPKTPVLGDQSVATAATCPRGFKNVRAAGWEATAVGVAPGGTTTPRGSTSRPHGHSWPSTTPAPTALLRSKG